MKSTIIIVIVFVGFSLVQVVNSLLESSGQSYSVQLNWTVK